MVTKDGRFACESGMEGNVKAVMEVLNTAYVQLSACLSFQ